MSKKGAKILQFRTDRNPNTEPRKKQDQPTPRMPLVGADDIYSQTAKAIDAAGKLDPEVERLGKEFADSRFGELENRVDIYRMNAISRNRRKELSDRQCSIEMARTETIMLIASTIKKILDKSYREQELGIFNNVTHLGESLLAIVNKERFLPDGNGKRARYSMGSDEEATMETIKMNFDYFFKGPLSAYASRYGIELMDFPELICCAQQLSEVGKSPITFKGR